MTTIVVATHNKAKLAEMRRIMEDNLGDLASDVELVSAGTLGLADPVETGTTFEQNALLKARFVAEQTGLPAVADDSGLIVDVMGSAPGILSARWCGRHGDDKANNELLLAQLADIPDNVRTARFRCAAALVVPGDDVDNTDADTEEFDMPHVGTSDVDTPGADIPDVDMPSAIKTDAAKADDATSAGSKRTARGARHSIVYAVTRSGEMPGVIIRKARGNHGFGYDPIFVPDDQPGRKNADGLPLTSAEMTAEEKNAISHRGKALRSLMPDIAELLESGNEWDASELQTTRRVVSEAHE